MDTELAGKLRHQLITLTTQQHSIMSVTNFIRIFPDRMHEIVAVWESVFHSVVAAGNDKSSSSSSSSSTPNYNERPSLPPLLAFVYVANDVCQTSPDAAATFGAALPRVMLSIVRLDKGDERRRLVRLLDIWEVSFKRHTNVFGFVLSSIRSVLSIKGMAAVVVVVCYVRLHVECIPNGLDDNDGEEGGVHAADGGKSGGVEM
jgi:hypothetical protein